MQYKLNIPQMLRFLLPEVLQKPKQLAWLEVLNKPVQFIQIAFLNFIDTSQKELNKNGQVIVLQKILREVASDNSILIQDYSLNISLPVTMLTNEALVKTELTLAALVAETGAIQLALIEELEAEFDFEVRVPEATLATKRQLLANTINKYKIQGRLYTLVKS